jgi:hypothetical protein
MTVTLYDGPLEVARVHAFAPELAAAILDVPLEQPEPPPSADEIADAHARLAAWLRALGADTEETRR